MTDVGISLYVVTDNPDHIARVVEAFARTAAGLALEGISVCLAAENVSDTEEVTDEA